MRTEPWPVRRCAWAPCKRPFSARSYRNSKREVVTQRYCSKGCSLNAFKASDTGEAIKRAAAALKVQRNARLAAKLASKFGAMTDRELSIYRFGCDRGYDKGYNATLSANRARRIAAETGAWSQRA